MSPAGTPTVTPEPVRRPAVVGQEGIAGARHFLALDAMRGLAAVVVLVSHVGVFGDIYLGHSYQAVDFFFILSGFVIGLSYEEKLKTGLSVGRFMGIRWLRMWPALFPAMLLGLAMTLLGYGPEPFRPLLLLNFVLLPVFVGHAIYPLNGPVWSIFYELSANLGHAFALPVLTTRRLALLTALCGVLLVVIAIKMGDINVGWTADAPWSFNFVAGFVRVGWGYLAGLLIYRLVRDGRLAPIRAPIWLAPAALLIALLLPTILGWAQHVLLAVVAFPIIILLAIGREPEGRTRGVARWLGGISYALYATHVPVLWVAAVLSGGFNFRTPEGAAYWCAWGFGALLIAAAFERFYDAPVRGWLRRRRSRGHTLAPAPTPVSAV